MNYIRSYKLHRKLSLTFLCTDLTRLETISLIHSTNETYQRVYILYTYSINENVTGYFWSRSNYLSMSLLHKFYKKKKQSSPDWITESKSFFLIVFDERFQFQYHEPYRGRRKESYFSSYGKKISRVRETSSQPNRAIELATEWRTHIVIGNYFLAIEFFLQRNSSWINFNIVCSKHLVWNISLYKIYR